MKNKMIQMYTDMIRSAGLKATPQRISVLKVLSEMKTHPSAEMLMEALEDQGYVMSVGTIYNILETFSEKGLILKLKDNQEVMRFDATTNFHVHIYNHENNRIDDLFDPELEVILSDYFKKKLSGDFSLNRMEVSLFT
ncbi:MAG: Fur family transcriptional regulator, peroxide stress response regulator [Eubacteriaceae bacterium]|jgi:Fe2+ or Zn2+ uptake regulation protein|nr:Fur family transcriptional regulator, peroxide stress response regulator [Eubacteriaceae bacterium]MDK2904464.1 Fur family transcriptional regulator, peroxide stress response regulator [Eubacteriaceae bacterium]MDK2961285.1 Fur family transcriptional regulator, peroxide stress response regulator [Eubacteriaceae bacterium]MDN5307439.1 Fur family transcriptional regulator, peroxide stress response regulator [Eubacteriaceae bacterium]